jgi:hypothetical protein
VADEDAGDGFDGGVVSGSAFVAAPERGPRPYVAGAPEEAAGGAGLGAAVLIRSMFALVY